MYEYTDEMREISGLGGGYEATCRAMVVAGCEWCDDHPDADPQFKGYEGIYGIITEENDDAKALSDAIVAVTDGDCTGAMRQASVTHVMAVRRLGWDKYVEEMVESI